MAAIAAARSGSRSAPAARGFTRRRSSALWPYGPVTVADHRRDADIKALAARILSRRAAALCARRAIVRRLHRLRDDAAGVGAHRQAGAARYFGAPRHARAERPGARHRSRWRKRGATARFTEYAIKRYLHRNRQNDPAMTGSCARWSAETGPEAFVRQMQAIMSRPDSRPLLASIRCPTLVLVGDGDTRHAARTQQGNRRRHCRCALCRSCRIAGTCRPSSGRMR